MEGRIANISKAQFALQCPMPKIDFEYVTLGHGSGGVLTNKLLDTGVFDLLSNPVLDTRHDGAVFNLQGDLAFTTDSFVISPIFFPGGDIGELAVNGTVNDIAMCGAIPRYISLGLIIEEGLPVKDLWKILVSIKYTCNRAGVEVVTGDTKVVDKGKGDKIFINTTGIGTVHPQAHISKDRIKPGDKVIVSHSIATHGMSIMSIREGLEFETSIESDTTNLNYAVKALLDNLGSSVKMLRDATRGGLATVLVELSQQTRLGMEVVETQIPVDSQVSAACELLGLDPMYVANEGVFVTIVSEEVSEQAIRILTQSEITSKASVIGTITEEHAGQVIMTSRIGGKRVVNMLVGEQLPRIC